MKYIKKFKLNEDSDGKIIKYHVGDYIELKAAGFIDNKPRYTKITLVEQQGENDTVFYFCVGSSGYTIWATNDRIERELDEDEIKKYELDSSTNKFNL